MTSDTVVVPASSNLLVCIMHTCIIYYNTYFYHIFSFEFIYMYTEFIFNAIKLDLILLFFHSIVRWNFIIIYYVYLVLNLFICIQN